MDGLAAAWEKWMLDGRLLGKSWLAGWGSAAAAANMAYPACQPACLRSWAGLGKLRKLLLLLLLLPQQQEPRLCQPHPVSS